MKLSDAKKIDADDVVDTRPRYVIRDATFALQPQPPIDWMVENLIEDGSVTMFYGDPGSKKTYAMLSLAVCAALKKPWLGFDIKNPLKVLFIDEESGERRLSRRLGMAIRGELGADCSPQIEYVSLAGFMLDSTTDQLQVEQLISETGAQLVIIDAMTDIMIGDENSKQDTQPVFAALRRIAERTRAAIILIHHSNKIGGYRGSSAISGGVDSLIKITSAKDSKFINFISDKIRDGAAVKWGAVATWTEDQFYLSMADDHPDEKALNKSQSYVIRYLKESGPSLIADIMLGADSCSEAAAKLAVYALADMGLVRRINPGERGTAAIYEYTTNEEKLRVS